MSLTLLAVPASALALSDPTGFDTHPASPLPTQITPRDVRFGARVHARGRVSPLQVGRTIVLESARSTRARWHRLASTRVGRDGGYSLGISPRRSGVLRAVELPPARSPIAVAARALLGPIAPIPALVPSTRAAPSSNPFANSARAQDPAAVSRVAQIRVGAAMRVPVRRYNVVVGDTLDVAGSLLPGRAGRAVAVQDEAGRGWRTLGHGRTGGRGGFAVRVDPGTLTDARLRVVFAGDRFNGATSAGAGGLTVYEPVLASWYDDAGDTACGFHAIYGVANKTLACGTRVTLSDGGRTVTATVDDRGPYVAGREFDLDQSTAAALGFSGVGMIDASVP